jgi:uncharacterized protein (TIGR03067 family)
MLRKMTVVITAAIASVWLGIALGDDATNLQGEWKLVEREYKGKKTKDGDADFRRTTIVIKGDAMFVNTDGGQYTKSFTVDPTKSPKEMDVTPQIGNERGETAAWIYRLENDRWTISFPRFTPPTTRPTEFTTGTDDARTIIYVLARTNPKP